MNKAQAIEQMNKYGAAKTPFLFIIDFEANQPVVLPLNEINPQEVLFDIQGRNNALSLPNIPPQKEVIFNKKPVPFAQYKQSFDNALAKINFGYSYLLNLSMLTPIETNLSLQEIFWQSKARYKLWYKGEWVVFSPEIFVQIKQQRIASYPMKGTIDASLPNAAAEILANPKEMAEHTTIVDLIRNDLSKVAKNVHVARFRYIDEVATQDKTLLQVSSKVVGDLPPDYAQRIGNILFELLPAGSISGAPKKKTVEVIKAAESYERGYYTGVFGYFDGEMLDSGVMIRFIENIHGKLYFKSGGGITTFSNALAEYQELTDKVYVPIIRNNQV
ncbi:aminodeoxychorismate synthase component I [Microscilla marina]|uniref:TrpE protein n=1 Tax=Microscilla marina ATCC 23134 TaxID=313606 RepID=A1ZQ46_MICM2|nr:aminodeoxychorismate synthase component I [Microscilla marina]EAY27455.1 TrpE protein [Microscilla marina ATCC 23134]